MTEPIAKFYIEGYVDLKKVNEQMNQVNKDRKSVV